MKSPFTKMRSFGLKKADAKGKLEHHLSLPINGLAQAAKDMKEMRTCYDSLLSAAAATANSAYEFSESLLEMGNCLLEKTSMHGDGESRGALSMLGKLQFELQKLVDIYRSHIIMTITNPSECLLSELRKVEEMKLQSDEKRETFEYMVGQIKEKGKSRHGKGETFSWHQLQVVSDEYDDAARLCIFRVESLKQGQSRSLLTQAARHHAAQLSFFRKGLQSLEAVEPYVKNVAEKQHIDYDLSELNEGETEGDEGNSFESNYYGELSFDYRINEQELDSTHALRNSVELNQLGSPSAQTSWVNTSSSKNKGDQIRAASHSAPIYSEKFDGVKTGAPKLTTYALPTPADAKGSPPPASSPTLLPVGSSTNMWHSSPLDIKKPKRFMDKQLSARKSQIFVEENNSSSSSKHSLPLPPRIDDSLTGFDFQRRQAFSGPVPSKVSVSGLFSAPRPLFVNVSPTPSTSPRISELHELPRPPDTQSVGHSGPLVSRNPFRQSKEGSVSALVIPQLTVSRSFNIAFRGRDEVASPTLTPISLNSGQIRGSNSVTLIIRTDRTIL